MRERNSAPLVYAAVMVVLVVVFVVVGDYGVAYATVLLGVPIVSGVLAGLGVIRFWHAVVGCLGVVVLDVVFDETWREDLVFFAVLGIVMVGIAALARLVTRWAIKRRGSRIDHQSGPSAEA
jgi:hypothetical protein